MHSLLVAALALAMPSSVTTDACAGRVPDTLEQLLGRDFPDVRLPIEADSPLADREYAATRGNACLTVASADFNGDGRSDLVLLLPRKAAAGYRLVVAIDSPAGYKVTSLESSNTPVTNLYVEAARPGAYSHTDAYEFQSAPGVAERIDSADPGFWFGALEAASDVYFLKQGRWVRVHASD